MTDNAHDRRTLEQRLQWIADWSEPGIDLADAGTAREALDRINAQAIRIRQLEDEYTRRVHADNVEMDGLRAELHKTGARPANAKWQIGDTVQKKRGSSWRGIVCGYYSTPHTPIGYCVDSAFEPGSVQVWPEAALIEWRQDMSVRTCHEGARAIRAIPTAKEKQ